MSDYGYGIARMWSASNKGYFRMARKRTHERARKTLRNHRKG